MFTSRILWRICKRLIETEIKERQTSAEAGLARRKAAEIEAAKNLELQLSVERKRREILVSIFDQRKEVQIQ